MSPSMIVGGKPNPDLKQDSIAFVSYALVYTGTSNGTNIKSIPYIALNESNNHGGNYYMRLCTGERLHLWIDRVTYWKQIHKISKAVVFRWKIPTS